jgi:hypothetical protein
VSFAIYLGGVVICLAGLVYGAVILDVPAQWIAVGAAVMLGISVITGVAVTRQKDAAS